ncbi:MAG: alpha-glucan family phosphorylase [Desulfovibrionaceae bacterium]
MQPIHILNVVPRLPAKLEPLRFLTSNYWFAWNEVIEALFAHIDQKLWRQSYQNPVWFVNHVPQETLEALANDDLFVERLRDAEDSLKHYLSKRGSSVTFNGHTTDNPAVAYFSLEYGICLSLPIYSGGLGMLAGDHLKSASDLNLPLVGMGLCYRQGYFRQYLTPDGWQQERYPEAEFDQLPLPLCTDAKGKPIRIGVELSGETVWAAIRKASVGRVSLYLLDTNIQENPPHLRQITARLYGGDLEMRLRQEILLGVGGMRALAALGIEPKVIHMNEGHSAFAGLERIRTFMHDHGLAFEAGMEMAASSSVFTTHTPVPAGNDRFPPDLMERYFNAYARELGLAFKVFMALGREDPRNDQEHFCMTVLALRLSRYSNGVSKLHGAVSRKMWKALWPRFPVEDVPIGGLTNGVHVPSWVAPDIALLYDRFLGPNWREDADCARVWGQAGGIPEAELWRTHERLRARLVDFVRQRLLEQLQHRGARRQALDVAREVLNPDTLTIGFARRFATYKRAYLLLRDKDRLKRLVTDPKRPVQFIFAGKAHPQDNGGKKLIQDLVEFCRSEACRFNMIFLEDYDMEVARCMVQGCDVWLNTPRRPLEACGTSGMKAMVNGVVNVSTLDGWWAEAFLPDTSVGYAIGQGEEYDDPEYQDFVESQILYHVLENDVIPTFYDRGHGGMPREWIAKMKTALQQLGPVYSAHRMVEEYAVTAYRPAFDNHARLMHEDFAAARALATWRMDLMTKWGDLAVRNVQVDHKDNARVGSKLSVTAEVRTGGIAPKDIQVEIYAGPLTQHDGFASHATTVMQPGDTLPDGWLRYTGVLQPKNAGRYGFTVRLIPHHEHLSDPHCLGLIHWAESNPA